MMTINCVPVVRKDQEATNGIVYIVSNILEPVIDGNLAEVLTRDGRFQQMAKLLKESDVDFKLDGSYTFFAPSDEVFQAYPLSRFERLSADSHATSAFLKAHVIQHVVCPSAVTGAHKLRNLLDKKLEFNCNGTGVYLGNSKLSEETINTENGAIIPVDNLIIPNQAKSVLELALSSPEAKIFVELINKAGAELALDGVGNLTVLAPSDEAFKGNTQQIKHQYC
ncbi:Stabilin-2 [Chamberlinius hualienensis]